MKRQKILLIRMLGFGDVTCIGIPALRYYQARYPDAEIHFMTYAAGKEIIQLAEPDVTVTGLDKGQWPDDIVAAMDVFLQLAQPIISENYTEIVNLDTWFMPCFLARFLKDVGMPVTGNTLTRSIDAILQAFETRTLSPAYVNDPAHYMASDWPGMAAWHTPWWLSSEPIAGGYPAFYLQQCCGFADLKLDMHIDLPNPLPATDEPAPLIAVATEARTQERNYPHKAELMSLLAQRGYVAWSQFDGSVPLAATLARLQQSDLLITVPSAPQWLAASVGTPSYVLSGNVDPRTLMPAYATPMGARPPSAAQIVDAIDAIKGAGSFSQALN